MWGTGTGYIATYRYSIVIQTKAKERRKLLYKKIFK